MSLLAKKDHLGITESQLLAQGWTGGGELPQLSMMFFGGGVGGAGEGWECGGRASFLLLFFPYLFCCVCFAGVCQQRPCGRSQKVDESSPGEKS